MSPTSPPRSPAPRPSQPPRKRRPSRRARLGRTGVVSAALIAVIALLTLPHSGVSAADAHHSARRGTTKTAAATSKTATLPAWLVHLEAAARARKVRGHLAPGSNPAVLPGPILIADRNNSRLLLVDPHGRVLWQYPPAGNAALANAIPAPDDAFFSPNGKHIVITEESKFVISEIAVPSGHLLWRYGHLGTPGSAANYLDNPDDAMQLPNGNVVAADIKNCRLLELAPPQHAPIHIYGETTPYCYHQPPQRFGSPNGMFPMTNGDWIVTEINGDFVDEMTPSGKIVWSINPPGITYPSDTNEVRPGVLLTASYTKPGVVEEYTTTGKLLWRYAPSGAAALNEPSLALPLPNGDVLVNDDWNDRVIVIDPHTNKVVWQYGVTGVPGHRPGYLYKPDGVDLAPPDSLDVTHAKTMGIPHF